ncbi:TPA: hypothetical protein ACSCYS_004289 [Aeromonas veronii]
MNNFKKYSRAISLIHQMITALSDEACRLSTDGLNSRDFLYHDLLLLLKDLLVIFGDIIITRQARTMGLPIN